MSKDNPCVRCYATATHTHHRKRRAQGGNDSPANLIDLCVFCHGWVHSNVAEAYAQGYLVKSWQDPAEVPISQTAQPISEDATELMNGPHRDFSEPEPGSKCPTCNRRVNHTKKTTSPKTKVFSVRVPLDDLEGWEESLDAAAIHLGLGTKPHHRFQTLNAGLVLILQAPKGLLE